MDSNQLALDLDQEQARSTFAALDLGSNSFHLIIARETSNGLQIIDRYKESVRLAEGLGDSGVISESSLRRAFECLSRLAQRLRDIPVHNVRVVGTAALRDARNRDSFLDEAEEHLHHSIEIISGREEARLIHLGVSHFLENKNTPRLVVDIGGGSTELIIGPAFRPRLAESLKMGCVVMTEMFFGDGRITTKRMNAAIQYGKRELEVVERALVTQGWDQVIGSSGTITAALTAIDSLNPGETAITQDALEDLQDVLIRQSHIDDLGILGISNRRMPVFPGGVAILCAVFDSLGVNQMSVSGDSLREGVLHDMLGRVHDEDIREQSVQALLSRFHVDASHARRVSDTALLLFQQVQDVWGLNPEDDANLLRWASLLHEIGMNISHAGYHKHGEYLLNNLDMPGFSMSEQQLLALLVRTHRRKYPILDLKLSDRIPRLSTLLRIAVVLRRNRSDDVLPKPQIDPGHTHLGLSLPDEWIHAHPLTKLDLEQEVDFLRDAPIQLRLEGAS